MDVLQFEIRLLRNDLELLRKHTLDASAPMTLKTAGGDLLLEGNERRQVIGLIVQLKEDRLAQLVDLQGQGT